MSCFSRKTGKVSADMCYSYKSDFHVRLLILFIANGFDVSSIRDDSRRYKSTQRNAISEA